MPSKGPIFGPASRALGQERLEQYVMSIGHLQAQLTMLQISLNLSAGRFQFTDDELACIRQDARDVAAAAVQLRNFVLTLCDRWQAQREEPTK